MGGAGRPKGRKTIVTETTGRVKTKKTVIGGGSGGGKRLSGVKRTLLPFPFPLSITFLPSTSGSSIKSFIFGRDDVNIMFKSKESRYNNNVLIIMSFLCYDDEEQRATLYHIEKHIDINLAQLP